MSNRMRPETPCSGDVPPLLTNLHDSASEFLSARTPTEVTETLVETASNALDLPCVMYYTYDEREEAFELGPTGVHIDERETVPTVSATEDSYLKRAYQTADTQHYAEPFEPALVQLNSAPAPMRTGLYVPVTGHGVIVAGGTYQDDINQTQRKFLEILASNAKEALNRVEYENALEEARTQMDAAADLGAVVTFEVDIPEEEIILPEQAANLYGFTPDEVRGGMPLEKFHEPIVDEDLDRVLPKVHHAVETGEDLHTEYRVRDLNGEVRWVVSRGKALHNDDGEPVQYLGAAADITEQKRVEQQLEESNTRLQQFAYAVSHDLQEPLRMVTSYLQLLENRYEEELDDDGQEFIDYAVDGADRMRTMIDDLLEYSRVETRGDPFEPTDLNTVLHDVQNDLQLAIDAADAVVEVDTLPTIECDSCQVRQLFQNLLENALKYSGETTPEIHVTAEKTYGTWMFSVSDNGIGIDADAQDRIFQVFNRLHTHEEYEGTGVGLALCQRIVERHGGNIWVDSEPGEGSTFSFTLPDDEP